MKDEIPCYASNLHPVDLETLEREAIDYVIQGFDAMYADAIYQHPPDAKNGVLQLPENVGLSAEPRSTRAFCGGVTMSDISFEYNIPVFPGALDACGDEPIHRDTPMYETLDWETTRAGIENAEALGFDAVWVPDHLMLGRNRAEYECWTLLSAIAGFTDDINVGSLVLCNDYRNPALVVKMAAILDVISGGRLELGIGAG